ncbi:ARMT1-like domain-containing protein [Mucisphaera sp.]|uniref:ARMT1-like domain-containing protein n=1 Tax=Mucisphaera sp. TaxID=2913024 RepID=UPI003D10C599
MTERGLGEVNPCFMPEGLDPADPVRDHRVFSLLVDPGRYQAATVDLKTNEAQRAYWLGLFRDHFPMLLAEARREQLDAGDVPECFQPAMQRAERDFMGYLDKAETQPEAFERLDILEICWARERVLRAVGIADPYRLAKAEQNEAALKHLPGWLADLDGMQRGEKWLSLVRGVLAGNVFDLGATKTVHMYQDGASPGFRETLGKLKPRPWFRDDADVFVERWAGRRFGQALLFVDNAGPDIVLGMIPLARELARYGRVILSANAAPSLNDVTHDELLVLLERVAALDPTLAEELASGRIRAVTSGNWAPLMDLSRVSPELDEAVGGGVDLVVLEGMGRAIESNYEAALSCDCLKIAMIKDDGVSEALGARLFDLVCRFDPVD